MRPCRPRITYRDGDLNDFLTLAHHHYHPDPPSTCAKVIVACDGRDGPVAGVLVVSMPVLNAAWRDLAFPGRYRTEDRRADAHRLNAEVRAISRVVVDPRYRGLGIGVELVRRYLAAPLTPVTEAVAAMGAFSSFFEAAGMRPYPMSPSPRDLRLADAIASFSIDPWMLADPELIPARTLASPLLARELRRWAQGSRGTRRWAADDTIRLLQRAAGIFHPSTAFVALREAV